MKKKILSIALSLCMVLTMMPMATGVAWAAASTVKIGTAKLNAATPYYHNGKVADVEDGSQGTADDNSTGANATFDSENGTLTLNGLVLNNTSEYSIRADGDLKIVIQNESNNNIGHPDNETNIIYVAGTLTISGSGTLTAVNGSSAYTTIYAKGDITINGGAQVTATHAGGGAQAINADATQGANYIKISGKNTTVTANHSGNGQSDHAVRANNICIFDGATLIATGSEKAVEGTVEINEEMTGATNTVMVGESTPGENWTESTSLNEYKYLKIVAAEYISVSVPTAKEGLTYDGNLKTGVEPKEGVYLLDNNTATDAGNYTATATLVSGYKWNDGTITPKKIQWSIAKADQEAPDDLDVKAPTTAGGKGKITGTTSEMEYRKDGTSAWTSCGNTETEVDPGDYYVRYKEKTNYNAGAESAKLTVPAYSAPSNPGGSYTPTIQKPTIIAGEGTETTLSILGTKLTIKVADDYELADVIVNGVSKGKVTELTGLKTGDKVEVKTEKKQEEPKEPTKEEIIAALDSSKLVARSKLITLKNGKKAVRVTWYDKNGKEVDFDGIEIYRSTQRYKGYGLKPFYATKDGKTEGYYVNTKDLKEGTTYYYKVRGYIEIDGQKYYTDYSLKAIRTVK